MEPQKQPRFSRRRPLARAVAARLLGLLVVALALAAPGPLGSPAVAQERAYAIDAQRSSVQVLVRRAGLFSLLAHDHVMVASGFAGRITMDAGAPAKAALQLTIPVASLVVDPPEARAALALDGKLNDQDRAEVRAAMLAAEQLDSARYPRVIVTLDSVHGTLPDLVLALRVRIRQVERVLSVPVHVELDADGMRATGEAALLQSDFGIESFSNLLGAIAVADRVTVRFRIVARAETG